MCVKTWSAVLQLGLCCLASWCHGAEDNPWKTVKLPPQTADATLRGICFSTPQKGWVVGDRGLCLVTEDGGKTWRAQATGSQATLRCVRFIDAERGFICGDGDPGAPRATGHVVMGRAYTAGTFLSTSDGGRTWKPGWVPCNFEVWCLEASTAPAVQVGVGLDSHLDGDITRSSDNGVKWEERRVYRALGDIRAADARRWIAAGSPISVGFSGGPIKDPCYTAKECRILFSDDAGRSWQPARGSDGSHCLRGLLVRARPPAFAVGDHGALLMSEDLGASWRAVNSPTTDALRAIDGDAAGEVLVAVGGRGVFILSRDAGKTWQASWTGQTADLMAVAADGTGFWAAGGKGTLLRCQTKSLLEAGQLPAPPAVAEEKAVPATAFQRSRVRVGDYQIYAQGIKAPAMGLDLRFETKQTVTAATDTDFTLVIEVIQGTPPPGMPRKSEVKCPYAQVFDFGSLKVTDSMAAERNSPGKDIVTLRLPDETVDLKGRKLACWRVTESGQTPDGAGSVSVKGWFCITHEVPLDGLVKKESTQTMRMPNGTQAKITMTQDLLEWGRGKE